MAYRCPRCNKGVFPSYSNGKLMKGKLIFSIIGVTLFVFLVCQAASGASHPKKYSNKQLGISFTIPDGIDLYTTENPGLLAAQISASVPIILVNPAFTEENINVQIVDNVSESNLRNFKKELDNKPNIARPQYKRISVSFIKIGRQKNETAIEHVFIMKGDILGKVRQVTFSHRGKGFIFTCFTAVGRFDKANQLFFNPLFDSMAFH
jgi:hypothetical protein